MPHLLEFFTVALIHLLAVMSPGPDFAMITSTSLTESRRAAVWASVGLGLGILVHVTYSLLGIGFVIAQSILLFTLLKFLGAAYLIFIGIKAIGSRLHAEIRSGESVDRAAELTPLQAVRRGFLTNVLNPKVTIFFVSIFAQVIDPQTPLLWKMLYGGTMSIQTALWFSLVALLFSHAFIKRKIRAIQHHIERVTGAVLILFGLKLALAKAE